MPNHIAKATDRTPPLWRWRELSTALGLPPSDGPEVSGISIDSRYTHPGELFVALPGDPGPRFHASSRSNRDGHDFVAHAAQKGAVGALVHRNMAAPLPLLQTEDTLGGLWAIGRARRAAFAGDVVAVTGSSGKTTAKTLLKATLDAFATGGSLNNHIGVPLSLARTPREAGTAVYEIGTNHPGEIAPLSKLVRPTVAVVLNVHPAHAEFFADSDTIRKEKLSIYNGLEKNGHLIVEESVALDGLPGQLRILRFGASAECDIRLLGHDGGRAEFRLGGQTVTAHVPGGGPHRARLIAAVLGVCLALERKLAPALTLPDSLIPAGRGTRSHAGGVTVVDESYNANPESMKAALRQFGGESGNGNESGNSGNNSGNKVAVLGEMLELGDDSSVYHAGLAEFCAPIDRIIAVGTGMRPLFDRLRPEQQWLWLEQADEGLLKTLIVELRAGDLVLVKGSNRVFWANHFVARLIRGLEQGE